MASAKYIPVVRRVSGQNENMIPDGHRSPTGQRSKRKYDTRRTPFQWVRLKTEKDFCHRKGPKRTLGHRKGL